jgi:cyclopropane fatty-acyl-phospholipid synthase-like methyltransferase
MPTQDWLKQEFEYGYDSGNVLSLWPNARRRNEEKLIGGSYRQVFKKSLLPLLSTTSKVLEIGPGRGSWSRAILKYTPKGELHTVDFQSVEQWLKPEKYEGRLKCHRIKINADYANLFEDEYFDVCWSFGVLCHNNLGQVEDILKQTYSKTRKGGFALHQYGDWQKLDAYGWDEGGIPTEFQSKTDDEIWWPRNNQKSMTEAAQKAGWLVVNADLGFLGRDSMILLQR